MAEQDTLLNHITRATIEADVFLTETQLESITDHLEKNRTHCCRSSNFKKRKNWNGSLPFCDHICNECEKLCTISPDVITNKR
ncbi:hypothetical protein LCGC14_0388330 [marine sediment metagenome]|uniref:Uncharacterized protein n=1 Tax=marine sediment metagenome TaxID=412755 RepID=A0A0F9VMB3_9ZZZZ